jgi:formate/nitrite transporter FocA (FNT family)
MATHDPEARETGAGPLSPRHAPEREGAADQPAAEPQPAQQRKRARERQALSARAVHGALLREGREELERTWSALAWSGLAAGISMGLSLIAQGALRAHLPDTAWRPLIVKLGYPVGFVAVTLGRQQLYTETTLTAMLPVLHERTGGMVMKALRLWVVVLAANLIGGWLFAWASTWSWSFDPGLRDAFRAIGLEDLRPDALTAFVRGMFGGWLIALMVWLMPSAHHARLWVIVLLTWLLGVTGLTHVIAGSIDVFHLVASGVVPLSVYVTRYGLPVLAGNTLGGVVFVAMLNHGQVSPDAQERRKTEAMHS